MVDKLKEKLFKFGLFGAGADEFTNEELQNLLKQKWVEVVTREQLEKLRQSFTQVSLDQHKKNARTIAKSDKLREALKDKHIRMNTVEWKNYFCANFNFISKEYYFVFDTLITTDDFVAANDLRVRFGIDSKKMFYIIKKLTCLGYVEKSTIEGKLFIRYKKNADGTYHQPKTKNKKESININDHAQNVECTQLGDAHQQKYGFGLYIGVPLKVALTKILNESPSGVCSTDLQNKLGIRIKKAHKILMKYCAEYSESIKAVDEFEGKIRRVKFYNINEYVKNRENRRIRALSSSVEAEKSITMEDRVFAISQQLAAKKAFPLDKKNIIELQQRCGWRYNFDRRTLIRSVLKGGFKLYTRFVGSDQPRYVVARADIKENDPVVSGLFSVKTKMTAFEKNLLRFFVLSHRFIELDNGFEQSRVKRLLMFHAHICAFMRDRRVDMVEFDMDLIGSMCLTLYFQLTPVRKVNFRDDLMTSLEHKLESTVGAASSPEKTHENILESVTLKDCILLNMDPASCEDLAHKFKVASYKHYLADFDKFAIFEVKSGSTETVRKIDVDWSSVSSAIGREVHEPHVPYETRDALFHAVKSFREENFYNACFRYVCTTFAGEEFQFFKERLDAFRKRFPATYKESHTPDNVFRNEVKPLIVQIKKSLLNKKALSVSDLAQFDVCDVDRVFRMLSTERVVSGFRSLGLIRNVHLHDLFRKKIDINIDHLPGRCANGIVRDDYYHHFYNAVYYLIVTCGSIERDILLEKLGVLDAGELVEFLQVYPDVFEVLDLGGTFIVSLR